MMEEESISKAEDAQAKKRHSQSSVKLIIRRLPFGVTEAEFHEALESNGFLNYIDWVQFIPGNERKSFMRDGRAYVRWKGPSAGVGDFKKCIEEHVFPGEGVVVMYAPNQRVRGPSRKQNTLEGTIECDQGFKDFCAAIDASDGKPIYSHPVVSRDEETREKDVSVKVTPLMEFLAKKHKEMNAYRSRSAHDQKKGKMQKKTRSNNRKKPPKKEEETPVEGRKKSNGNKKKNSGQKGKQSAVSTASKEKTVSLPTQNQKQPPSSAPKILSRQEQGAPTSSTAPQQKKPSSGNRRRKPRATPSS